MIRIAHRDDLAPGQGKVIKTPTHELALFRIDDTYHVIDDWCPHQGGSLGEGTLDGHVVLGPWHGWAFDVRTGQMPGHPKIHVRSYPVVIEGDDILVELPMKES